MRVETPTLYVARLLPAGPVLIGTLAAALLLASGWLVNDHLDARTLPLPDLTIGVRTICLGGAA